MSLSQQQQQQRISLLRYNPTTNTATPTNYRSICDEEDDQEEQNENTTTATTTIAAAAAVHHVVSNGGSNTTIRNHNNHHNNHHRSPSAVSTTTHTTGVKSSTVSLRPMGYLTNIERRKRYRFIIVMVLLCIGIAVTLVLWFYSLHVVSPTKTQRRWWWWWDPSDHRHHSNDTSFRNKYNVNTNLYDSSRLHNEMQHIANTAVQNLNTNFVTSSGDEIIPDSCETTLLVFRHCDKLDTTDDDGNVNHKYSHDNNHDDSTLRNKHRNRYCSEIGYDRAQYITTLFGNTNTSRWPVPNYLWALSSHRAKYENYREYETLLPLSQMISVPIQNVSSSTTGTPADTFANQYYFPLLTTKQMCGQISVVSWKHHWIPALVQALGCGPDNGCPMFYPTDTFDAVWELKFIFHSTTTTMNRSSTIATTTSSESTDPTLPRTTGLLPTRDEDTESSSNSVVVKPSVSTFHLLRKKDRKTHHRHHHHHRHKSNDDDKNILPIPNTWESDTTNVTNHPPHWIVMGTVTYQMFDPLQYSTQLGHYPHAMGDP